MVDINRFSQTQDKHMKNNVGVWIDHKKAVIVRITDGVEEVHSVASGIEKHVRFSGGKPEDQQEHRFANHLKEYYDKVISFLHHADSILILGPGEAKGEFEKRLATESFGAQIVGIETEDKMTDHQIAAKVREHFLNSTELIQEDKGT
jgi:stalled ribosome rescue protein Dom34